MTRQPAQITFTAATTSTYLVEVSVTVRPAPQYAGDEYALSAAEETGLLSAAATAAQQAIQEVLLPAKASGGSGR